MQSVQWQTGFMALKVQNYLKTIYKNLQETCELRNRDPNLSQIGTQNSNSLKFNAQAGINTKNCQK